MTQLFLPCCLPAKKQGLRTGVETVKNARFRLMVGTRGMNPLSGKPLTKLLTETCFTFFFQHIVTKIHGSCKQKTSQKHCNIIIKVLMLILKVPGSWFLSGQFSPYSQISIQSTAKAPLKALPKHRSCEPFSGSQNLGVPLPLTRLSRVAM